MEKDKFDHYKDRENTKINLVIYGSFGFSAAALYILANDYKAANMFVVLMFLLSLMLSLCSFFYWYKADYLAYVEHENQANNAIRKIVRPIQSKMAFICLITILASYSFSFFATLLAFTKIRLFECSSESAEVISWLLFSVILSFLAGMIIYHYRFCSKKLENMIDLNCN